ncbi:response regulator [Afifella aestuarii]|uniref:response regulator n=1 Tax=Afifella aestuarii TaxID=1909496 RepID=UPI000FE40D9F|nr:response regulator [Afifella aestuarii]
MMVQQARILLAENQPLVALDFEFALCDAGYEVLGPVGELTEGLRLAEETRPDAAVLDVQLADGHVFPLARALMAAGVPIMFVTAHVAEERIWPATFRNCPRLGKPVDPEVFRRTAAGLLAAREDEAPAGVAVA